MRLDGFDLQDDVAVGELQDREDASSLRPAEVDEITRVDLGRVAGLPETAAVNEFELVPEAHAGESMPASFGTCMCSCPIYDHGRMHKDGNEVWVGCRNCGDCTTFRASDGSAWPNVYSGAVPADPTDLDVNTDAWVDGEVLLSHERSAA